MAFSPIGSVVVPNCQFSKGSRWEEAVVLWCTQSVFLQEKRRHKCGNWSCGAANVRRSCLGGGEKMAHLKFIFTAEAWKKKKKIHNSGRWQQSRHVFRHKLHKLCRDKNEIKITSQKNKKNKMNHWHFSPAGGAKNSPNTVKWKLIDNTGHC